MKKLSPKQAAETIDFFTIDPEVLLQESGEFLIKLQDHLEDWNCHSENAVVQAIRYGKPDDILEARAILRAHRAAGHLSHELEQRRHALLNRITFPETITPPDEITVPRALFEKMACAMFGLAGAKTGWVMPEGGPETYGKIWKQALPLL